MWGACLCVCAPQIHSGLSRQTHPPSDNERSRGEPGIGGQTGHIQRTDFNLGGDDLAASGCLDTCPVGQDKLFTE